MAIKHKEMYDRSRFDICPFEKYQKWAASRKPELDWVSYTKTVQEPSTVDFKNLSELNIFLDKSAIRKIQPSFHQSSTSHQIEDNAYSHKYYLWGEYYRVGCMISREVCK